MSCSFQPWASLVIEDDTGKSTVPGASTGALVVSIIRIGCLGLLAYWSLVLVTTFLTIIIWRIILAVALYPVFDWLVAKFRGRRKLAAVVITLFSLLVILGPATWLGLSLAVNLSSLVAQFGDGSIVIPPPPEAVQGWPLIGEKVYEMWYLASTNLKALLVQAGPQLKPLGSSLLGAAGSAGLNLIKFITATVISGFLFIPGPALVHSIKDVSRLIATDRGEEFVDLAGASIRNVSRGVIGISVLQALLAGIGLMVAGIPAAGLVSFLVLLLGIIQIGPSIILLPLIIWSWFAMETTSALIFTVYMLPVNLLDNVLRPLVMAQGLNTPMLVIFIGVVGGTLAHGMIGLFIGPIVLAIAWQLLIAWMHEGTTQLEAAASAAKLE